MESKQHHFVLVHGGGHGAWCWARIVPVLENAGHRVATVDLVGAGENPLNADDCTSFEQYNQPLEDLFRSFPDDEKVILVGHSLGGMSLTYMSEHFPKKIAVAVYLAAFMPGPGMHIFDMVVKDPTFIPPLDWQFTYKVEGGPPTAQAFSSADLKEYFYNQCDPQDLAFALTKLRTWPYLSIAFAPIKATEENYGSVPKVYIVALADKAICPATCHKMIKLNPPNEVIDINADHSMFFCAADTVVRVLIDIAAKY